MGQWGLCPTCNRDIDSAEQRTAVRLKIWPAPLPDSKPYDPDEYEQLGLLDVDDG